MRTISQLLLTFLLNSVWQIALIATLASVSSWLLRDSAARYRHWLWVAALLLSVGVPLTTSSDILTSVFSKAQEVASAGNLQPTIPPIAIENARVFEFSTPTVSSNAFLLSTSLAIGLALAYSLVLLYGAVRFCRALYLTRRLRLNAVQADENERLSSLIRKCSRAISEASPAAKVCFSELVPVPITIGVFTPVIIVPKALLEETNEEILISAIGHELIHVQRRDYALNLLYEFLFLLLSFHPAAVLIRRRIRQTRELSCDELVAERILNAEVYARSLVQLASCAPTLRRLSVTTTVGIADADILEVRVMSLLKKQKQNSRWKKSLLALVSLLLLIPSLAAASLATKFDVEQAGASQDQDQKEKESKEKEKARERRESKEYQAGWAIGQDEKVRTNELDGELVTMKRRHEEEELKARAVMQATLVRLARVPMDQAIQIATSQSPGKVLECSLNGEHWEEPGKLAKDGVIFYHVVILSPDENEPVTNHVLVNAIDGTIIKSEKELPRKIRSDERP
jgi:beta-lactamase regulating signal transducer with metallopeptidase domain